MPERSRRIELRTRARDASLSACFALRALVPTRGEEASTDAIHACGVDGPLRCAGVPDRSGTGVVKSIVVDGVHQRIVVLSLDCSSSFDATTLVGVEDTDISVCVRSVGGSGLQITIPGPRAKERC